MTTKGQQQDSLLWKKSSASRDDACVEVAEGQEMMFVRDSKDPQGPVLTVSMTQWKAFQNVYIGGSYELRNA